MARKRALEKSQTVDIEGRLPLLYNSVVPLTPEQHKALHISDKRDFSVAATTTAIPLTCDEFSQAMRDYPIVFSGADQPTPLALVGLSKGRNDQVDKDGSWRTGTYVPAYLRRYPFLLVKEQEGSDRQVLCADLTSMQFEKSSDTGQALFDDGAPSERLKDILEFARRYETAILRTSDVMRVVVEHDLIQASTVNLSKGDKSARIEGFSVIAEEKVRALEDAKLADLARRGILALFTAHQMSLANFSTMGAIE